MRASYCCQRDLAETNAAIVRRDRVISPNIRTIRQDLPQVFQQKLILKNSTRKNHSIQFERAAQFSHGAGHTLCQTAMKRPSDGGRIGSA